MSQQPASAKLEPTSVEIPNLVKAKKPGHFIGGTDDGQSIRQKQPRRRRNAQSSAVVDNTIADGPQRVKDKTSAAQVNPNMTTTPPTQTTVGTKKPAHYIGGSDDGNSIRQKQPHKRRGRH